LTRCGTCVEGAEPGSYGYCPEGMPPPEGDDDVVTVAKPGKDWGFCSKLCKSHELGSHQLKVNILCHVRS